MRTEPKTTATDGDDTGPHLDHGKKMVIFRCAPTTVSDDDGRGRRRTLIGPVRTTLDQDCIGLNLDQWDWAVSDGDGHGRRRTWFGQTVKTRSDHTGRGRSWTLFGPDGYWTISDRDGLRRKLT